MSLTKDFVKLSGELFEYLFPEGIPRNSFIIIAGKGGSGKSVFLISIVKSLLNRGEPVLYMALDDDPKTVIQQISALNFNVVDYVKKGLFFIVDGYSYRIRGEHRKMHVSVIAEVDPQNMQHTINTVITILDENKFIDRGVLVIDSLNEFLSHYKQEELVEYVKDMRANISKARGVTILASLHTSTQVAKDMLNYVEHCVDGVIIARRSSLAETQTSFKILIKRMKGVRHQQGWVHYALDEYRELKILHKVTK
jgi:KaiC/GvpD/RAD55 family RecA-like ATPase